MEPDQSLSWFDVAVGGAVLVSALLAFTRGLLHEVLGIVPWLGGAAATVYGFPLVRPYARELIGIDLAADAAAGVVLFFAAFIVLSMFSRALFSQVPHSALNVFDRSLGFLFGLARGAFLLVLAYLGLGMFLPTAEHPEWIRDARTRPAIEQGVAWIRTIVPTALVSEGAQKRNRRGGGGPGDRPHDGEALVSGAGRSYLPVRAGLRPEGPGAARPPDRDHAVGPWTTTRTRNAACSG